MFPRNALMLRRMAGCPVFFCFVLFQQFGKTRQRWRIPTTSWLSSSSTSRWPGTLRPPWTGPPSTLARRRRSPCTASSPWRRWRTASRRRTSPRRRLPWWGGATSGPAKTRGRIKFATACQEKKQELMLPRVTAFVGYCVFVLFNHIYIWELVRMFNKSNDDRSPKTGLQVGCGYDRWEIRHQLGKQWQLIKMFNMLFHDRSLVGCVFIIPPLLFKMHWMFLDSLLRVELANVPFDPQYEDASTYSYKALRENVG